jgi:hypothetical protein
MMTTEQLAAQTDVPRNVILGMLDAGWSTAVTIKDGTPFLSKYAIQIVTKARALADQTVAGAMTPTQAWIELQRLKQPKQQ